jgi:hypothetical protein
VRFFELIEHFFTQTSGRPDDSLQVPRSSKFLCRGEFRSKKRMEVKNEKNKEPKRDKSQKQKKTVEEKVLTMK